MRDGGAPPARTAGRGRVALIALVVLPWGISCSGESLSSVSGQVLVGGQPAAGAVVVFHPVSSDDEKTLRPTAVTDTDGRFELSTGRSPGAPPGKYVVTVTWPEGQKRSSGKLDSGSKKPVNTDPPPEPKDRLDGRYAKRSSSKLTAEVGDGDTSLDPFRLD